MSILTKDYVNFLSLQSSKKLTNPNSGTGFGTEHVFFHTVYVWLINRKINGYYGWLIIEKKILSHINSMKPRENY